MWPREGRSAGVFHVLWPSMSSHSSDLPANADYDLHFWIVKGPKNAENRTDELKFVDAVIRRKKA